MSPSTKQNEGIVKVSNEPQEAKNALTPKNTPKPKEKKIVPPGVNKSVKKGHWKKRPKPAHSGVPVPEKMRAIRKLLKDSDCSF